MPLKPPGQNNRQIILKSPVEVGLFYSNQCQGHVSGMAEVSVMKSVIYSMMISTCVSSDLAISVPGCQNEVSQSKIHGGISGEFWELIQLIQLHHVGSHTQCFTTFIRLVEGLEIWRESRHYTHTHNSSVKM